MPWATIVPLTIGAVALGSLFGALEVATVAFADDAGRKALAGLMLGVFALGSLLAGIVAGVIAWRSGPLRRAQVGMGLLAVGTVFLPFLSGLVVLTVFLFLTGLALAPTLIALFSLIESTVPRSRLNEAMGFVQTGISAGIAPGAWLAGVVADEYSGSAAFWTLHRLRRARGPVRDPHPRLGKNEENAWTTQPTPPRANLRGMTTWSNWTGLATAHPTQELSPHDAGEVVEAVVAARHQNLSVKMTGSGHSFTDIAVTDGLLLRPDSLRGIVGVDRDAMTVTALAGTPLHELNRALERLGLSLHNLGDIEEQTLAGAISTGTHGTGGRQASLSAQVAGLELVTGEGVLLTADAEENPDILDVARLGLGALGILTSVTIARRAVVHPRGGRGPDALGPGAGRVRRDGGHQRALRHVLVPAHGPTADQVQQPDP